MSLIQTMLTHLDPPEREPSQQAPQLAKNDSSAPEPDLFVSTDLETAKLEWAVTSASDVEYNGKIYRRLEPEYFAWLRNIVKEYIEHYNHERPHRGLSRKMIEPYPQDE